MQVMKGLISHVLSVLGQSWLAGVCAAAWADSQVPVYEAVFII